MSSNNDITQADNVPQEERDLMSRLTDPFEAHDIEWRVQQSGVTGKGKPWVIVIPYVTNRAIQQRLDDVFGFAGWQNAYSETPGGKGGYLCGITVEIEGRKVTKWDGAEYTGVEPLKGALSNSMKRAAVQLGIGRYLYNLDEVFAQVQEVENRYSVDEGWEFINVKVKGGNHRVPAAWKVPQLPEWALPSVKAQAFIDAMIAAETLEDLKKAYGPAYKYATAFKRDKLLKDFDRVKNSQKASIEEKLQEQREELEQVALGWLQNAIEVIADSENPSVVKNNLADMEKALSARLKSNGLSDLFNEYLKQLQSAAKKRTQQLKNV